MNLVNILGAEDAELARMPPAERRKIGAQILKRLRTLKQENQIYFYTAANPGARGIHLSTAREIIATGGNRSSKTDTMLAELAIQLTGIVPRSLAADYPREKLCPPIRARLVCTSLTNTWETVIKPKLQYWQWNGAGIPEEGRGHYGWIPRAFLTHGKWEDSWSEKHRILSLVNGSSLQIMSYDQAVQDFQGGSYHLILHDEGPPQAIWRENKLRTLDTAGRMMVAMTPPDDEGAAWDAAWVYDDLYEKGQPGPYKDPRIDAFTLFTEDNAILDKKEIASIASGLSPAQREVRLKGRFLHLSGRIYPVYSDREQTWCFKCNDIQLTVDGNCCACGSDEVTEFSHFIEPFDQAYTWPHIFVLDPHPRKPHMMCWIACDPVGNWWITSELEMDSVPTIVANAVAMRERDMRINVRARFMDPNMGKAPAGARTRHLSMQQEFASAGLRCDLANDNRDTARQRIREMLRPSIITMEPSLRVFKCCPRTNYQFMRYCWDEWTRYTSDARDSKPVPRDKHDDFPTMVGYFANSNPTHDRLLYGARAVSRFDRAIY